MNVRFWGVRGSVAVSGGAFARTGGNTTTVEVEHEGHRLILDGGTGLAALGTALGSPVDATLLFTHVHWDHIQGVPFFAPAYHPGSKLTLAGPAGLARALRSQMKPPTFPVTLDAFNAALKFEDLTTGRPYQSGPFTVRSLFMDHPDGVLCYRIECGKRSVVFATDVEHGEELDSKLVAFCEGADLVIHDAQYTDAEYRGETGPCRKGWGHSTWEQAVEVGWRCGAGRLALFHHDPTRNDDAVSQIESLAAQRLKGAFAAREGLVVAL